MRMMHKGAITTAFHFLLLKIHQDLIKKQCISAKTKPLKSSSILVFPPVEDVIKLQKTAQDV